MASLATLLVILGSCQSVDDIARIAARTHVPQAKVSGVLDEIAVASGRATDDLGSILAQVDEVPPSLFDDILARAEARLGSAGKGAVCDALAEAILDPEGLDEAKLKDILIGAMISVGGGDAVDLAFDADSILEAIQDGQTSSLWVKVTLLKIQHC